MTRNIQELTVSELSRSLKRTVEDAYSYVKVRGEISGFKRAASGHLYMALKDTDAVLDAVCWRGAAGKLSLSPEDGMEVVATGRLTTYPGRSKYQIVIEQIELAGEGALLKLLEERRRRLAEEGLFDEQRKRRLPFLPEVIGVVTSPTGAVIRDILHRLADRFPRHVLLWPVLVQGDGAAEQVAEAIRGFNALPPDGPIPRPDLLIVARGGGSLEDLWAFNEEVVVRAAAGSDIPLISAVGHETDTTLIDFASDRRAPTPTAAAEIAVPVRGELLADVAGFTQRMMQAGNRSISDRRRYLEGLARGLPKPDRLLAERAQRLDDLAERLSRAAARVPDTLRDALEARAARLRSPRERIERAGDDLAQRDDRLRAAIGAALRRERRRAETLRADERLAAAVRRRSGEERQRLDLLANALEALSYKGTLRRGYAVIRSADGAVLTDADGARAAGALEIEFRDDGKVAAVVSESTPAPKPPPSKRRKAVAAAAETDQPELF
jgi:exodeoxyribonuclease VII large subunit